MTLLKIARMGHPVLQGPAEEIADPTAPELRLLVRDMLETMEDAGGTGLAAPQVHVPRRLVLFFVSPSPGAPDGIPLTVLVNPEIVPLDRESALGWEGCLSVPGLIGEVPRHTRIRYRGLGLDGATIEREAHDYHARVVQHEVDHLDGILYPQRMQDLGRLIFESEQRHLSRSETERGEAE
ncbi:MAG: peptide deformylase [Rhodospirillales bacterium]|nr:peptide deformylase [Rhodospirillales bacterium]